MNISYLLYQAERPLSPAEQRETDTQSGELAASVARLRRSLRHKANRSHTARPTTNGPAKPAAACIVPRPR